MELTCTPFPVLSLTISVSCAVLGFRNGGQELVK